MRKFLLIFIFIYPAMLMGQSDDYRIYSMILNQKISEWCHYLKPENYILIVDQFCPNIIDKEIDESLLIDEFCDNNFLSFYDESKRFNICSDDEFKNLLASFRKEIVITVNINRDSLELNIPF